MQARDEMQPQSNRDAQGVVYFGNSYTRAACNARPLFRAMIVSRLFYIKIKF